MTLVVHAQPGARRSRILMLLGLAGAALFYGDGMITPAVSVLSAIEGLEVATPAFKPYVIPLTLIVLTGLFMVQKWGTGRMGSLFGPVMALWFRVLALLGIVNIAHAPGVLAALNPSYAVEFLFRHGSLGFFSLGAVVLVVTGAEALYADMGHFGRVPVRLAWMLLVLPSLTLNYFGQGALLLADAKAIENPFYLLAPDWALYPLVVLSTVATVIASQAMISGAFSITQQAMQLGYCPRMTIQHTSSKQIGQIYLPGINWALFLGVVVLVVGFKSSTNLAAAYGIAVTGTMTMTTILAYVVARSLWKWSAPASMALFGVFLLIDVTFFSANLLKVSEGGWVPLVFGLGVFTLMSTWKRGRRLLRERLEADSMPLDAFIASASLGCATAPGTAVFMTTNLDSVPHALLHSLKHYKSLHSKVILLNAVTLDVPHVPEAQRVVVESINSQFHKGEGVLRLHGHAGPAPRARMVLRTGPGPGRDGHVLFPRPRNADSEAALGHGVLAREAVRFDVPQRRRCRNVVHAAARSRRRTGVAGRAVRPCRGNESSGGAGDLRERRRRMQAAGARNAGKQVFHLVGQDAPVAQDEVLVAIGDVRHVEQRHARLLGRLAAFADIAVAARGDRVGPGIPPTPRHGDDVVPRQVARQVPLAAIGTQLAVAREQHGIGKAGGVQMRAGACALDRQDRLGRDARAFAVALPAAAETRGLPARATTPPSAWRDR
jgi:KUP system potassium uptake protein